MICLKKYLGPLKVRFDGVRLGILAGQTSSTTNLPESSSWPKRAITTPVTNSPDWILPTSNIRCSSSSRISKSLDETYLDLGGSGGSWCWNHKKKTLKKKFIYNWRANVKEILTSSLISRRMLGFNSCCL